MGIPVGCDIHPWMRAYLCIVPNPYFGVSGRDGLVQIGSVPPGNYTIAVWHESLGTIEQKITLPPRGEVATGFTYREVGRKTESQKGKAGKSKVKVRRMRFPTFDF
jgi:hypothetical protein